jgi:hypothetical protein
VGSWEGHAFCQFEADEWPSNPQQFQSCAAQVHKSDGQMSGIEFKIECSETESFVLIKPDMGSLRSHMGQLWGTNEPNIWYTNAQGDRVSVDNDDGLQAAIETEADNGSVSLRADLKQTDVISQLQGEIARLREEMKSERLQAQEKFDAAVGVLSRENESLMQKLKSAACTLEQSKAEAAAAVADRAEAANPSAITTARAAPNAAVVDPQQVL